MNVMNIHSGVRRMDSFVKKRCYIASPEESAYALVEDGFTCRDNWWNRHRFNVASHFLPQTSTSQKLLDFGCGNGIFLKYLVEKNYQLSLFGYDPFLSVMALDTSETEIQMSDSLQKISSNSFDFVTALDVIEHIEDDISTFKQINKLLNPNGTLLITVPSYQCLYSLHDAVIGHYRRYTKRSIVNLLEQTGFSTSHVTYLFSFLVIPATVRKYYLSLRKMWRNDRHIYAHTDYLRILSMLTSIEIKILQKTGFWLPFGTSIFVSAKKIEEQR